VGELIFMAVVAVISVIMFVMSFFFQTSLIDQSGGPALFPRIVIILLLFFMIMRAVSVIRSQEALKKKFVFFEMFHGSRLFFILLFLGYACVVQTLGFAISSSLFAIIAITYLHKKQYGRNITLKKGAVLYSTVVLSIFALYFVFTRYFSILLPSGFIDI
jgi:hypothetical protein